MVLEVSIGGLFVAGADYLCPERYLMTAGLKAAVNISERNMDDHEIRMNAIHKFRHRNADTHQKCAAPNLLKHQWTGATRWKKSV